MGATLYVGSDDWYLYAININGTAGTGRPPLSNRIWTGGPIHCFMGKAYPSQAHFALQIGSVILMWLYAININGTAGKLVVLF